MNWIAFPDERLQLNGLPWFGEDGELCRLPQRLRGEVPEAVWGLSWHTTGARLRFATDSTCLGLRARFRDLGYMNNMPRTGQVGVDLWVDGDYWRPLIPATQVGDFCELVFQDLPRVRREVCLHLGLYAPIELLAIGVDQEALIEPPTPFTLDRPVVYYGASITQGGCASHAGMSYQAIVSRALNADFVNLGFSGQGRGEPAVAEAVAEINAACYVMEWCRNCPTLEEVQERYDPFLQVIRQQRPLTPILCLTPTFSTREVWGQNCRFEQMRQIIRNVVARRTADGDAHLALFEGFDLLGPADREGLVDGTHPSDLGLAKMAAGLESVLREVLGL